MSGVEFTVSNRANNEQKKNVKVNSNLAITNYTGDKMPSNGLKIEVKDGKKNITATTSDNKQTGKLRSADMASYKYTIFQKIMKLDKNDGDLSEKDLSLVTDKMDGVKKVRRDKEAGVTTIVFDNGEILKFDFETDKEKAARLEKKQTTAQTTSVQQDDKNVQKIDSRSTLEKGLSAVIKMFID